MINNLKEFINRGPFEIGRNVIVHNNKAIETTLNSRTWEKFIEDLPKKKFEVVQVGPGVAHRPDLISQRYYGSTALYWVVLLANGLTDPFEGLNSGDLIKIVTL